MKDLNNLNDDYLWDGSGPPDPEVQELERRLGRLRHRGAAPRLPIPVRPRRSFSPVLAAAAALALMILGLGVWVGLRRDAASPVAMTEGTKDTAQTDTTNRAADEPTRDRVASQSGSAEVKSPAAPKAGPKPLRHKLQPRSQPKLDPATVAAGQAAKARLMLALRIASAKLNEAQKKVQEGGKQEPSSRHHPGGEQRDGAKNTRG